MDEYVKKAEQLLAEKKADPYLLEVMGQSLNILWEDLLLLFQQRREVLDINGNLHEKIGICWGKMSALEEACRDTMIPNEIDTVHDLLANFKQLRIEMLAAVMVALKEGNALLAKLRETAMCGKLESRPDNIKIEIKKAVTQVERWLEDLSDRRNYLEQAWQTRKIQLEQCLALAILSRDIHDMATLLDAYKKTIQRTIVKLCSEADADRLLELFGGFKHDATALRDKALRITRSTEKIAGMGRLSGDDASSNAYVILNECAEHLEFVDTKEIIFAEVKEFFAKAEKCLSLLEKIEMEISTANALSCPKEAFNFQSQMLAELANITDEPLTLGYALLNKLGRSAETTTIERLVGEIENRKINLREICSAHKDELLKITETVSTFWDQYNDILAWLVTVNKTFLPTNNDFGHTIDAASSFLRIHRQFLNDLVVNRNHVVKSIEYHFSVSILHCRPSRLMSQR